MSDGTYETSVSFTLEKGDELRLVGDTFKVFRYTGGEKFIIKYSYLARKPKRFNKSKYQLCKGDKQ